MKRFGPSVRGRRRAPRATRAALPATLLLGASGCGVNGEGPSSDGAVDVADRAPITSEGSEAMKDAPEGEPRSAKTATRGEAEAPLGTLLVSLRAESASSAIDAPFELVVEARNATAEGAEMLLWNTPFEPVLSADTFAVARDGEPVPYRGRTVKRATPPGDGAVVRLAPGETLERTVALSNHYAMDAPGTYEIGFVPRPVLVDDGSGGVREFATLVPADAAPLVVERR